MAHAKIIVFSESLAVEGISKYISTFVNNVEVRPDCNIIISRCSAEDFLNNSSPSLETLSARYYEQVLTSSEYTGFTTNTTLTSFYSAYKDYTSQPVAILGGINSNATHNVDPTSSYVDLNGSYKADETPIKNKTNLEFTGIAVFDGDKLVGELTGMDSICHLICTNKFKSTIISIPSPFNEHEIMDLYVQAGGSTKNNVSIINGSPYIKVSVKLKASVASSEYELDLTQKENLELIEKYASSYIKEKILDYLYATSKSYHSDIADFGRFLALDFLTVDEFMKIDWAHLYPDSFFDVDVTVKAISGYLLVQN